MASLNTLQRRVYAKWAGEKATVIEVSEHFSLDVTYTKRLLKRQARREGVELLHLV